jgi:hypothetical protein
LPAAIPGGQYGYSPSCPAGSLLPDDDMDLPGYACLLRDAAGASAASWAEPLGQREHDRAVRQLAIAVRDLRVLAARLAGRFRLNVIARPGPAQCARAAAVTASAQALGKAWLILEDVLPVQEAPVYDACVPADLLCFAARRAATWPVPVTSPEEITQPLAGVVAALAGGTASLAAGAAQPLAASLTAAEARLRTAGGQLRDGVPSAVSAAARQGPASHRRDRMTSSCRRGQAW